MITQDDIRACAALVEKGDPDRFLAAMAAPVALRGGLMVLYAFNLEIARAPWVTQEPLIAHMRLQFWRDVVAGETGPAHEVAGPLVRLIAQNDLPRDLIGAMIDARAVGLGEPAMVADEAALWAYLAGTGGALMALAVILAGGRRSAAAMDLGIVQGLAAYLVAVPALEAAGKQPLPDGRPAAVAELARSGLARLAAARAGLRALPRAPLLAAWQAEGQLRRVARDPGAVAAGALVPSEFARRGGLLWRAWRGI